MGMQPLDDFSFCLCDLMYLFLSDQNWSPYVSSAYFLKFWNWNNYQTMCFNCFVGLDIMVEGRGGKRGFLSLFHGAHRPFWSGLLQQHWLRGLMHPVQFLFSVLKMTSSPYVGAHQRQRQLACMLYPLLMKLPVNAILGVAKRSISSFLTWKCPDCWPNKFMISYMVLQKDT